MATALSAVFAGGMSDTGVSRDALIPGEEPIDDDNATGVGDRMSGERAGDPTGEGEETGAAAAGAWSCSVTLAAIDRAIEDC